MLVERPLARDDLDVASRVIDDETAYFLGDPLRNEYKQLDELQYEVFSRLDGRRTLADIAKELYDAYEVEVSAEDLAEFVQGLDEMHLLDASSQLGSVADPDVGREILARLAKDGVVYNRRVSGEVHLPPKATERRRRHDEAALMDLALARLEKGDLQQTASHLRSVLEVNRQNHRARHLLQAVLSEHVGKKRDFESIWFWRIPVVNPDRVLKRLDRALGSIIYTRTFMTAWAIAMAVALCALLLDIDRVIADFKYVFSFAWLVQSPIAVPILWTIGIWSVFSHEMAHGVTCRHYGGRVREMGILGMYMSVTAYCDISSSYLIQDRWHRAYISFAGAICQSFMWLLFVAIYTVVRIDTTLGVVAFVVVLQLPSYFANFNPLVRSDGYLALSDLLDYPNLRDDAFTYLRLRLEQIFLGSEVEISPDLLASRRLYLWYAVPGIVGTLIFVTGGLYIVTSTLIAQLHTLGLVFASFILWVSVGQPLMGMLKKLFAQRRRLWALRRFRRMTLALLALVVAVLLLPWRVSIDAECETRPKIVTVRTTLAGAIETVLVEDGARVNEGEPLMQLLRAPLEAALARSSAELKSAELELEKVRRRARDEELGVARARLASEQTALRASDRRLSRLSRLANAGLISSSQLDELTSVRQEARTRVLDASGSLEALSAAATDAELAAAEALVGMLRAQVEEDQRRLDAALITSPAHGIVQLPPGVTLEQLSGSVVAAGDELMRVRRHGGETIELHIPITEPIGALHEGAVVSARLHGMPHEELTGRLERIGASFEVTDPERPMTRSLIRAEVKLDDETLALGLPAGLSGRATAKGELYPLAYHAYLRVVRLFQVDAKRVLSGL